VAFENVVGVYQVPFPQKASLKSLKFDSFSVLLFGYTPKADVSTFLLLF
jgi:hypothetical protein